MNIFCGVNRIFELVWEFVEGMERSVYEVEFWFLLL